jgi:acyl-CoA synthetase (AMP-forming)/AMP-acid ligase II
MTDRTTAPTTASAHRSPPGHHLGAVHEAIAARVPDRECIVFRDRRLTFADVTDRSRRLARVLHDHGLGAHAPDRAGIPNHESHVDHVAIYAVNGNEYLETMLGACKARTAPVNVNYRYVGDELRHVLADSGARAIVYHAEFAPTLGQVLADLPGLEVLIQIADESANELLPGARWYEEALAGTSGAPLPWAEEWSPDDLYVLYTGGTTGAPKGVLWRQADIHRTSMGGRDLETREPVSSLDEIAEYAAAPRRDVTCPAAPFMHGAGHWVAFMAMNQGSTVVIQDDVHRLDPVDVCGLIEREGVTFLQLVGDAFGRPIVAEMETGRHDLTSLRTVLSGGAALSPAVKARLLAVAPGLRVVDGLGSSEGGGQGMQITTADGTSGRSGTFLPSEGTVVVNDERTALLAPGDDTIGWMAKRGDIPLGYLGDPEKTARTFPVIDGTRLSVPGDRARWRADGSIEMLGRDSATINSGGEKIFAEEVEAAIAVHPSVADVIVTSRPSKRWGQEVVAVVQLGPGVDGPGAEEDLAAAAAERIARYKLPKAWVFVDEVRRSPAGKADLRWAKRQAAGAPP